ncbi:MAG: hypothetical protein ACQERC_03945 [Bacteroidota bacterium]
MRNVIIIVVVLFSFPSCTKVGRNITVKGKVVNPVTNTPFEGIEVWFQRTTNQLPGGYKTIKEEITDANGEFEINATRIGGTQYIRLGDVKGNYRLGWYEDGEYKGTSVKKVTKGKTMEVEYHLVPYGELKIHFQNQNCQGSSDTLELYLDGSYVGFDDSQIGKLTTLTGCVDLLDDPINFPMGERYYHWVVKRGGNVQTFYDTVFLEPNQVTTLDVFY